jgi:hypothetical protein
LVYIIFCIWSTLSKYFVHGALAHVSAQIDDVQK